MNGLSTTLILIVLTALVSWAAFNNRKLLDALILWPPAVSRNNEYHRLLSYGLVHADFAHLLFNMITLYFFGRALENYFNAQLGPWGFAFFYALGLLVSILPTYAKNRDNPAYRSLGASGAVSAVLFSFILLQPWTLIYVYVIPVPAIVYAVLYVAYSVYQDRRGTDNINHSAHLWGAAYGVVFTLVMDSRVLPHFLRALTSPGGG